MEMKKIMTEMKVEMGMIKVIELLNFSGDKRKDIVDFEANLGFWMWYFGPVSLAV